MHYRYKRAAAAAIAAGLQVGLLHKEEHMSFVTALPAALASAAGDLQSIGAVVVAGNTAAAGPTTAVAPAAADEVSALTAAHFAAHAVMYQAIGAEAAAIHELFVTTLATSAGSYLVTEIANAATVV